MVKVEENDQVGQPLIVYIRHLSPVGSLLNRSWFDFFTKSGPTSTAIGHDNKRQLLKVEIAGVTAPPQYVSTTRHQRGDWLKEIANNQTRVSCQLLGRRVSTVTSSKTTAATKEPPVITDHAAPLHIPKRDVSVILPELNASSTPNSTSDYSNKDGEEQIAVCKLYYRPSMMQLFSTDIAASMVKYGRACVNAEIFLKNDFTKNTQVVHASSRVHDMRRDIKYLENLESLEYDAARKSYGMWADPRIREMRRDVMDEVEFQTKASIWRKLWRWLRG